MRVPHSRMPSTQRGAVLVVSLLLLLVMTLLGLGASQSTRLQERMAGNQRDMEAALQGSEGSLRGAERLLDPTHALATCISPAAYCEAFESNILPVNLSAMSRTWWDTWGRDYPDGAMNISGTPEYVIERIGESRDTLSEGGSYVQVVRDFHRSTSRSAGISTTSEAVLQSTHSRISFVP